jgi:hypothetical protein
MRVLICGARDYPNRAKVEKFLDVLLAQYPDTLVLIEGKCPRGADLYAHEWGRKNLPLERHLSFPANWDKYHKAAGPIRNQQMLDEGKPDVVVAFGGLNGVGTNDMVRRSKKAGLEPVEIDREQD